jgi:hypothetical protein
MFILFFEKEKDQFSVTSDKVIDNYCVEVDLKLTKSM